MKELTNCNEIIFHILDQWIWITISHNLPPGSKRVKWSAKTDEQSTCPSAPRSYGPYFLPEYFYGCIKKQNSIFPIKILLNVTEDQNFNKYLVKRQKYKKQDSK